MITKKKLVNILNEFPDEFPVALVGIHQISKKKE